MASFFGGLCDFFEGVNFLFLAAHAALLPVVHDCKLFPQLSCLGLPKFIELSVIRSYVVTMKKLSLTYCSLVC